MWRILVLLISSAFCQDYYDPYIPPQRGPIPMYDNPEIYMPISYGSLQMDRPPPRVQSQNIFESEEEFRENLEIKRDMSDAYNQKETDAKTTEAEAEIITGSSVEVTTIELEEIVATENPEEEVKSETEIQIEEISEATSEASEVAEEAIENTEPSKIEAPQYEDVVEAAKNIQVTEASEYEEVAEATEATETTEAYLEVVFNTETPAEIHETITIKEESSTPEIAKENKMISESVSPITQDNIIPITEALQILESTTQKLEAKTDEYEKFLNENLGQIIKLSEDKVTENSTLKSEIDIGNVSITSKANGTSLMDLGTEISLINIDHVLDDEEEDLTLFEDELILTDETSVSPLILKPDIPSSNFTNASKINDAKKNISDTKLDNFGTNILIENENFATPSVKKIDISTTELPKPIEISTIAVTPSPKISEQLQNQKNSTIKTFEISTAKILPISTTTSATPTPPTTTTPTPPTTTTPTSTTPTPPTTTTPTPPTTTKIPSTRKLIELSTPKILELNSTNSPAIKISTPTTNPPNITTNLSPKPIEISTIKILSPNITNFPLPVTNPKPTPKPNFTPTENTDIRDVMQIYDLVESLATNLNKSGNITYTEKEQIFQVENTTIRSNISDEAIIFEIDNTQEIEQLSAHVNPSNINSSNINQSTIYTSENEGLINPKTKKAVSDNTLLEDSNIQEEDIETQVQPSMSLPNSQNQDTLQFTTDNPVNYIEVTEFDPETGQKRVRWEKLEVKYSEGVYVPDDNQTDRNLTEFGKAMISLNGPLGKNETLTQESEKLKLKLGISEGGQGEEEPHDPETREDELIITQSSIMLEKVIEVNESSRDRSDESLIIRESESLGQIEENQDVDKSILNRLGSFGLKGLTFFDGNSLDAEKYKNLNFKIDKTSGGGKYKENRPSSGTFGNKNQLAFDPSRSKYPQQESEGNPFPNPFDIPPEARCQRRWKECRHCLNRGVSRICGTDMRIYLNECEFGCQLIGCPGLKRADFAICWKLVKHHVIYREMVPQESGAPSGIDMEEGKLRLEGFLEKYDPKNIRK